MGALLAIIFANGGSKELTCFLNAPVNLQIGDYLFFQHNGVEPMTLAEFINDALMAFFSLVLD